MKFGKVLMVAVGFCLLLGAQAFAQANITKGTLEIGGTVGFDYDKATHKDTDNEWTTTSITLMPRMAYFFTPKIAVEGMLIFDYTKYKETYEYLTAQTYETENSRTNMGIVAAASYHFVGESNMVPYVFAGAGILTNGKDVGEGEVPDDTEETSLILPAAGAGLKVFVSDHLGIRMEAMYMRISNTDGYKDFSANHIRFNVGLTGFLGQK